MAERNGAAPDQAPRGVIGAQPRSVILGPKRFQVKAGLPNKDMRAQQPLLDAMTWNAFGDTPGRQYYIGAASSGKWEPLVAWLSVWTDPPMTMEDLDEGTPDETIALIETILEDSGLSWLRDSLGNQRTAMLRVLAVSPPASAPFTPDADLTSSTASSSPLQDPPPTPESMSPETS